MFCYVQVELETVPWSETLNRLHGARWRDHCFYQESSSSGNPIQVHFMPVFLSEPFSSHALQSIALNMFLLSS